LEDDVTYCFLRLRATFCLAFEVASWKKFED
jgi:hypothetical protein